MGLRDNVQRCLVLAACLHAWFVMPTQQGIDRGHAVASPPRPPRPAPPRATVAPSTAPAKRNPTLIVVRCWTSCSFDNTWLLAPATSGAAMSKFPLHAISREPAVTTITRNLKQM